MNFKFPFIYFSIFQCICASQRVFRVTIISQCKIFCWPVAKIVFKKLSKLVYTFHAFIFRCSGFSYVDDRAVCVFYTLSLSIHLALFLIWYCVILYSTNCASYGFFFIFLILQTGDSSLSIEKCFSDDVSSICMQTTLTHDLHT